MIRHAFRREPTPLSAEQALLVQLRSIKELIGRMQVAVDDQGRDLAFHGYWLKKLTAALQRHGLVPPTMAELTALCPDDPIE